MNPGSVVKHSRRPASHAFAAKLSAGLRQRWRAVRCAAGVAVACLGMLPALAQPVLITSPATINPGDTMIMPTGGPAAIPLATADITVRGTTLTVNGRHTIRNLVVESNGAVTHGASFSYDYSGGAGTDVVNGMWLSALANPGGGNVTVDATSRIDATGKGYAGGAGPGAPTGSCTSWAGATHGGLGGVYESCATAPGAYGSFSEPSAMGSGGSGPANGGGVVRLDVSGRLTVNGSVRADGASDGWAGSPGAGGSIRVDAGELDGSGTISADGGDSGIGGNGQPNGPGSGGGRVALTLGAHNFDGEVSAYGGHGRGAASGGAGTQYVAIAGQTPQLIWDNGGNDGRPTELAESLAFLGDVIVRANAVLAPVPGDAAGLQMFIDGDLIVEADGRIDATGKGYAGGAGPGAPTGSCTSWAGATHGGIGGVYESCATAPGAYGSFSEPSAMGSGGSGPANGGGVVRLDVSGRLTVNGSVRADGASDGWAGSPGAGGSIRVDAGELDGSGTISADGGDSGIGGNGQPNGPGSGGGRVALTLGAHNFDGEVSAYGGHGRGATSGGAGTIWIKMVAQPMGELTVANSFLGARTTLDPDMGMVSILTVSKNAEILLDQTRHHPHLFVVVEDGGRIHANASLRVGWLSMLNGSVVTQDSLILGGLRVSATHDILIDASSRVDVRGLGHAPHSGPGYPHDETYACHVFGNCCGSTHTVIATCPEGHTSLASIYGSAAAPVTFGSGSHHGVGGGVVKLTAGGSLIVDGVIDASAPPTPGGWSDYWADGGSGGSIWITASEVEGTGQIVSRGVGRSAYGPVAIYACTTMFPIDNIASGSTYLDTDGMLIVSEPSAASFCAGPDHAFTFEVLGATSFQWFRDGLPLVDGPTGTGSVISGSSTSTLTIVNASTADAGAYRATASSACGSIESQDATLGNCPAEYNCDDGVDILDFLDFIDDFAACELQPGPCGSLGNADTNGDTLVDILDFLDFIDSFGTGCG